MTIDPTILGASQISQNAFNQLLQKNNPNAPDGVVEAYYNNEARWGIRADILVGQMFLETGYLTSNASLPPRRNMAGIGITADNVTGLMFDNYNDAVNAHYAHMSAYVYTDERNNASALDPRYKLARNAVGNKLARELKDLNNRWAMTPDYDARITRVLEAAAALDTGTGSVGPKVIPRPDTGSDVQGFVAQEFGPGTVNGNGSFVRARPSFGDDGTVLRKLDKGTVLHFIGLTDAGPDFQGGTRWYCISPADGGGWIHSKLVS